MTATAFPPVRGKLLLNEPLGPYTWFRVGGAADALFLPADAEDLADFLKALDPAVPVTVLGVGSNVIVRDGVTGTEVARSIKQRNVDYTIRYDEGRILMKEPVQGFADGAFITNHNLGQVASGHRVFVEVEYEHRDDRRLQGLAGGADVNQRMFGLVDLGGSYVVESREDGGLAYQVGGLPLVLGTASVMVALAALTSGRLRSEAVAQTA